MSGQLEIRIVAPALRDVTTLEAAIDRAAAAIYAKYPSGGPCVAGDAAAGELSLQLAVDSDDPDAWLPQLEVLVAAVSAPSEVHVSRRTLEPA